MQGPRSLRVGDPERLGAYRLIGLLGEGGQGTVFLGVAPDGRQVAIKVLHAQLTADGDAMRRFLREVEVAQRVAPFCTARVLEAATVGDRPFVVSEYVPGESLRELVRREGPRDEGSLERLAVGTASALAAIHQAGIIHLDFKPANVLIGGDGPRVIDFGIAKALDAAATTSSGLIGTPAYMSPEQISGHAVGPASDVFSWGSTLLYAATGRSPFGADSVPAVMHRIINQTPDLGPLPPSLRPIVAAALNKDPARRPTPADVLPLLLGQNTDPQPLANLMTQAVQAAVDDSTLSLRRRSTPARRTLLVGGLALAATAAAGGAWYAFARDTGSPGGEKALTSTKVLSGHSGIVFEAAFAPNGQLAATAGEDATIRLWDMATGQSTATLTGHTGPVQDVAFSPDSRTLASAGEDGGIRIWDVATQKTNRTLAGHNGPVYSVSYRKDGLRVVSAGDDGTVRTWDPATGLSTSELRGHEGNVYDAVYLPDGTTVVSVGNDKTLRFWDMNNRVNSRTVQAGSHPISAVAASPDGKLVATGSDDLTVRLWNPADGSAVKVLEGHGFQVWSVAFSPDGTLLASSSRDQTARVWNTRTHELVATLKGHTGGVFAVAFKDGKTLITTSEDKTARLWTLP